MKARYRLVSLSHRGGMFYCFDTTTKQRNSLGTKDPAQAKRIVDAKNDSLRQPTLNLNIARAYLAGTDAGFTTRTWKNALEALTDTKHGEPLSQISSRTNTETNANSRIP